MAQTAIPEESTILISVPGIRSEDLPLLLAQSEMMAVNRGWVSRPDNSRPRVNISVDLSRSDMVYCVATHHI